MSFSIFGLSGQTMTARGSTEFSPSHPNTQIDMPGIEVGLATVQSRLLPHRCNIGVIHLYRDVYMR
jgi:hypothetical protein